MSKPTSKDYRAGWSDAVQVAGALITMSLIKIRDPVMVQTLEVVQDAIKKLTPPENVR